MQTLTRKKLNSVRRRHLCRELEQTLVESPMMYECPVSFQQEVPLEHWPLVQTNAGDSLTIGSRQVIYRKHDAKMCRL